MEQAQPVTGHPLHIDNVFELHKRSDQPTSRLLVVFSAANASSFTFFNAVRDMRPDRLHIRDPFGKGWYQRGLADGETLHDIETRIAEIAKDYKEIWMLGSSMGGYAALYFGARLKARKVLALAPQILVDGRFSRGPGPAVKVQTPSIADLVLDATSTRMVIAFGSHDLIDIHHISQLYKRDLMPMHIRVLQYLGQDHMLPAKLHEECGLQKYFQAVLSRNSIAQTAMEYTEGPPISADRLAIVETMVDYLLQRDFDGAYAYLRSEEALFTEWPSLRYYCLLSGIRGSIPATEIVDEAADLSDREPGAIDFAFLAADCAERSAQFERARLYLDRTLAIRRGHPKGKQMDQRLRALAQGAGEDAL